MVITHDIRYENLLTITQQSLNIVLLNMYSYHRAQETTSKIKNGSLHHMADTYTSTLKSIADNYRNITRNLLWRRIRKLYKQKARSFYSFSGTTVNRPLVDPNEMISTHDIILIRMFIQSPTTTSCTMMVCPPGLRQIKGILLNHQSRWQKENGWTCRKCQQNLVKSTFGNETCHA